MVSLEIPYGQTGNFLLYSNAKGKPPSFAGNEAGFDSPNTDNNNNNSSIPHLRKQNLVQKMRCNTQKKHRKRFLQCLLDRVGLLMKKLEHRNCTSIKAGATPDGILHQLSEAIEQQQKLRKHTIKSI
jgi:hypothetical protein